MESFEPNSKNSRVRDITEVGIGLGLAMGHLTGTLNESNMFSTARKAEHQPGFPGADTSRKRTETR
jgi:hypothetical protein